MKKLYLTTDVNNFRETKTNKNLLAYIFVFVVDILGSQVNIYLIIKVNKIERQEIEDSEVIDV